MPEQNSVSGSASLRGNIEAWLQRVSSHPRNVLMSAISVNPGRAKTKNLAPQPKPRAAKRLRAESDSSDLPETARIVVSRQAISIESDSRPSSPAQSDHAPSEASSEAVSEIASSNAGTISKTQKPRNDKTIERRLQNDPVDELAATIKRDMKSSRKDVYDKFELPVLDDATPHTHHIYACKACKSIVARRIGHSSTSQLKHHLNNNCQGKPTVVLEDFGIIGPNRKPTKDMVREVVALRVSESARPFTIVDDRQFQRLLHPHVRQLLPSRVTVSKDVKTLHKSTQEDIIKMLKDTLGALHIALDLYSTANGASILGLVLYRQVVSETRTLSIQRFVLECLNFEPEHTGVELAKGVYGVLRKFKIADRVWGLVCDNASNNALMMELLAEYGMKRLIGVAARSFCMLHVLNISVQHGLKPFCITQKQLKVMVDQLERDGGYNDEDEFDLEQASDDEDIDPEDDGTAPVMALGGGDDSDSDEEVEKIDIPEIEPGSPEAQEAERAYLLSRFSHKLRYIRHVKTEFKLACVKEEVGRPHHIRRDMIIRWNASKMQFEDAERTFPAILATQNAVDIPYQQRLRKDDRKVIRGLIAVLKPMRNVTKILSHAEMPLIAEVIPHYDALTFEYDKMCADDKMPLYLRHMASRMLTKLNKHYGNTDQSELYRIAILLHPSLRVWYLRFAKWEPDWIEAAIDMTVAVWKQHYKSTPANDAASRSTTTSQFGYSTYMDRMMATTSEDGAVSKQNCPIRDFVLADPIRDRSTKPPTLLNPITWWQAQRVLGNNFDGLTQMALDVLSAPATSVDVERAFSFVGSMVTKRRHRLSPCTVEAAATLGFYSKAGLVKEGTLAHVHAKAKPAKKAAPDTSTTDAAAA